MKPSFLDLLASLHTHRVDFVVVGGVAALIEGAPITTLDLDVVYRVDTGHISRLLRPLEALDARYRDPAGPHLVPSEDSLAANRLNLLETSAGPLDVMQEIGDGWRYEEVVRRSVKRSLETLEVSVLELEAVIESKVAANRAKDRAMLPVLRATLDELRKTRG
jgi:hypothetical protein